MNSNIKMDELNTKITIDRLTFLNVVYENLEFDNQKELYEFIGHINNEIKELDEEDELYEVEEVEEFEQPLTIDDVTKALYEEHGTEKCFRQYRDKMMTILTDNRTEDYKTLLNDVNKLIDYVYKRCKATTTKHKFFIVVKIIISLCCPNDENIKLIEHEISRIGTQIIIEKEFKRQQKEQRATEEQHAVEELQAQILADGGNFEPTELLQQQEQPDKTTEPVIEPVIEEPIIDIEKSIDYINKFDYKRQTEEPITYDIILKAIDNGKKGNNEPYSKQTIKSYKNCIQNINNHFNKVIDYRELLKEPEPVIDYIYKNCSSDSTKKSHLVVLMFMIKTFAPNKEIQKKIIELTMILSNNLKAMTSNKISESNLSIDIAYEMMHNMKANKTPFNHLVLNYGVMRADELYNLYIVDNKKDVEKYDNTINIKTKIMTIKKHKTAPTYGTKITKLDDEFIDMVKDRLDKPLFVNLENKPYKGAKGLNDKFIKLYGCTIKELRKMKSSIILKENIPSERERTSKFQGHDVQTMILNYQTYN